MTTPPPTALRGAGRAGVSSRRGTARRGAAHGPFDRRSDVIPCCEAVLEARYTVSAPAVDASRAGPSHRARSGLLIPRITLLLCSTVTFASSRTASSSAVGRDPSTGQSMFPGRPEHAPIRGTRLIVSKSEGKIVHERRCEVRTAPWRPHARPSCHLPLWTQPPLEGGHAPPSRPERAGNLQLPPELPLQGAAPTAVLLHPPQPLRLPPPPPSSSAACAVTRAKSSRSTRSLCSQVRSRRSRVPR